MSDFTRKWKERADISSTDKDTPIRQVYVWILTNDQRIIVVSKDGDTWQLPGGKPEADESLIDTAIREVGEETGLDIVKYRNELKMFGYYVINEPASDPIDYLQVRFILNLPVASSTLGLNVRHEDSHQARAEIVRSVESINIDEISIYIPWMPSTDEHSYVMKGYSPNV